MLTNTGNGGPVASDVWPPAPERDSPGAGSRGHRLLPHTADLRLQAWAPTRDDCVAEAVRALVDSFATTGHCPVTAVHVLDLGDDSDEGVLLRALDEVVYLLDTDGVVPVTVEMGHAPGGVRLVLGVTGLAQVDITGPPPKGVARSGLRFDRTPSGWTCQVTVDV